MILVGVLVSGLPFEVVLLYLPLDVADPSVEVILFDLPPDLAHSSLQVVLLDGLTHGPSLARHTACLGLHVGQLSADFILGFFPKPQCDVQ